ncbi:hypothetical protein [Billgrantia saliphila]|uniref:hypothetical protein n=1 Tax=Billgrantia saliphila TaxID=1848458 RepID=UPI000CE47213|nr:hypothetical protein [Halomonas saliphila]
MIKIPDARATAAGLALLLLPLGAAAATLSLPTDARLAVQTVDELVFEDGSDRRDDILLRPVSGVAEATDTLPEYCVVVADARQEGARLRITTKALTCIETSSDDSRIYSGEISAAAYELDDSYGIPACDSGRCVLSSDHTFLLRLADDMTIEEQDNPSERINEQRRQADGTGVANPIPAQRPDPDDE